MVNRIEKALRRLSDKERRAIKNILRHIKSGRVAGLDIKKLKGSAAIYRVRKGGVRIIYAVGPGGNIKLLAIERRSDTTYSKY